MDVFDRAMHKVGLGDWDSATPCADWTVRDLVNHIVNEQLWVPDLLAGTTVAEVGDKYDGDRLDDDPLHAWTGGERRPRGRVAAAGSLVERPCTSASATTDARRVRLADDHRPRRARLGPRHRARRATPGIAGRAGDARCSATSSRSSAAWQGIGVFADPVPVPDDADPPTRLVGAARAQPVARLHLALVTMRH